MKQLLLAIIASAAISFSATAQSTYSRYNGEKWEQLGGSGKLVQLNTPVAAFSNVEISHMNVQVVVESNTQTCALEVSIDDNLKDFFRYKVEGATLKLSMDLSGGKYKRWLSSNNTVVTIKAPSLQVLSNKGNTSITVKEMKQSSFNLISDGNADISLTGSSNEFYLQSNGNSDIDAGKFVTHKTTINTTGNSEIRVNAKELVEQNVKGNVEIVNEYNMPSASVTVKKESITEMVRFKLRNNSILPSKVTVISYRPDEKGNGTTAFVMMPYGTRTYRFPAGTKIYLASQQQVNTVMSGAKISDQPPFLTVKKEDNNQTFNIND
ncbi:DUF2807 domain-containing protein [Lacibacter sp. MH-610]|uniref:GIN domain-containing protein n=1 Tax=Lacibacter sp. MH-610 TaxID=3020883 RepID=UPI0038916A05